MKFFLAISKKEQLKRFEARLHDPYKHWKLTPSDLSARAKWNDYVKAVDEMLERTDTKKSPWNLVPADDKDFARIEALRITCRDLRHHSKWMEHEALVTERRSVKAEIAALRKK